MMGESKYIKMFLSESREHIRKIGKSLDTLTRDPSDEDAQAGDNGEAALDEGYLVDDGVCGSLYA